MDKVSHKGMSNYCFHCWYFHRVSLRGFAQRWTVHPGRQDLLGSLLFPPSGPQNSRDPRRGGKAEIPQMMHDLFTVPVGTEGTLEPWNGEQESNPVPEPLCKAQCLRSHSPALLWLWGLKPVELQSQLKEQRTFLQSLAIYLPHKIPPWKILCHTEKNCLGTPPPEKNALYKNRFWNRKVNNYSLKEHLQAAYK